MTDGPTISRRGAMAAMTASVAAMSTAGGGERWTEKSIVEDHDASLRQALKAQVTDPDSPYRGAIPDRWGLCGSGSAARILRDGAAACFHPESHFRGSQPLLERMKLAADFLSRSQSPDGNIDLITTNFNSPPDTGFVVHSVATAARIAQLHGDATLLSWLKPFLVRAGQGMARGGIHTPNHRWVVAAALAQVHELFPDGRYVRRIDQWLAEGIDIDQEGQFTERSTTVYNAVSDNALVVMARKLNRPELLDAVRKNLNAMAYLLHSSGEVVTEISRRQDLNSRGTMSRYWFSLRYMALHERDGLYSSMLRFIEPDSVSLAALMEYPDLRNELPAPSPLPDNFEKHYPLTEITRIRSGKASVTIMHQGNDRWVSMHHGLAVINAVRFATAFFGKGQFSPDSWEKRGDAYHYRQELQGPYYQPIDDPSLLPVTRENWARRAGRRRQTEINRMVYEGKIWPRPHGLDLEVSAQGTDGVPLAVEINVRDGGQLQGVEPAPHVADAFLLKGGHAEYRMGTDVIQIEGGPCAHAYTQIRGAQKKLAGPSIYITGLTPFRRTLRFRME